MKKVMMAVLLTIGMTALAQEKNPAENRKANVEQLTPQQRNELRVKELTLELGLNASQQKDMAKLLSEQTTKMEAAKAERTANKEKNVKPTADEQFARRSKMLDEQIAMKEKVKKILTPEQFEKWEKMKMHKKDKMHKRAGKRAEKRNAPEDK